MMNTMLAALAGLMIILGVTAGFYTLLYLTSGEALMIAGILLSLSMYIGAAMGAIRISAGIYIALGICGFALFIKKEQEKKQFFSPGIVAAILIFCTSVFLYRNAFIHSIDDFHQWAAAVKYMLERGHLPGADFLGSASMPAYTGTFHLFFQVLGGYHEGNMYASSMLLNAIPLMLPLCGLAWKDWKKSIWYVFVVYLGMYHLYVHPYKSLYVDVPAAAWAAGLSLWMLILLRRGDEPDNSRFRRRPRISNVLFWVMTAYFLIETKWGTGILMLGFTVFYMLFVMIARVGVDDCRTFLRQHRKGMIVAIVIFVLMIVAGLLLIRSSIIPVSFSGIMEALTQSTEKAQKTFTALYNNIFSKKLHSASRLQLTAVICVSCFTLVMLLMSPLVKGWEQRLLIGQSLFTVISFLLYVTALYITYVSTFSYDESTSVAAVHRYLSVIILYLFYLMMGTFIHLHYEKRNAVLPMAGIFILFVFAVGLKVDFVSEASGYHYWDVVGYESIRDTKKNLKKLNKLVGDAKVYMLNQGPTLANMNEFPMCTALYYREGSISNYLKEPWKFTEDGSLRMIRSSEATIEDFPQILADGEYEYLWIYDSDKYLREELPEVITVDTEIADAQLYKIEINDDGSMELIFVSEL